MNTPSPGGHPPMIAVSVMGANRGPSRSLIEILRGEASRRKVLAVVPAGYLADELSRLGTTDVVTHDFGGRVASSARLTGIVRDWVRTHCRDPGGPPPFLFANGIGAALRAMPAVAGGRIERVVLHVHPSHLGRRDVLQMKALQRIPGVTVNLAAVSPFVIGLLSGTGVCLASDVSLLPNLVSPGYLDAGRRRLREDPAGGAGRLRILYVGTDSYRKGFDVGIGMLKGVASEQPIATVRFAGFNPHRPPSIGADQDGEKVAAGLRELAGLTDVQMLGRMDDLLEEYLAADIVVVPTRMESFGRVALEAAAAAAPLVCSNNPGHMTFLAEDTAFTFQVGDVASGFRALLRAVCDSEERVRRRERAFIAAERYTWDVWRDAAADLFDQPVSSFTSVG